MPCWLGQLEKLSNDGALVYVGVSALALAICLVWC